MVRKLQKHKVEFWKSCEIFEKRWHLKFLSAFGVGDGRSAINSPELYIRKMQPFRQNPVIARVIVPTDDFRWCEGF